MFPFHTPGRTFDFLVFSGGINGSIDQKWVNFEHIDHENLFFKIYYFFITMNKHFPADNLLFSLLYNLFVYNEIW